MARMLQKQSLSVCWSSCTIIYSYKPYYLMRKVQLTCITQLLLQIAIAFISYRRIKKRLKAQPIRRKKHQIHIEDLPHPSRKVVEEEHMLARILPPSGHILSKIAHVCNNSHSQVESIAFHSGIFQKFNTIQMDNKSFNSPTFKKESKFGGLHVSSHAQSGPASLRHEKVRPSKGMENTINSRLITIIPEEKTLESLES